MTTVDRCSLAALGAILLVAFALRAGQIADSLWLDELHTAWVVDGTLREIPARAAIGNQSPMYFYLPWATTRLFGLNEAALRLPSLVAGVAIVAAIYALVRRMTNSHAGALLAAWLAAINPNFLWYSLEARPYAWVQLVGVLQVFAFWQTLARPTWRSRVVLVAISLALFYLHYTAALLVAAEAIYFAIAKTALRDSIRYSLAAALVDVAIFAACCVPAIAHLQAIAGRREAWWKFVPHDPPLWKLLTMFPLAVPVGLTALVAAVCRAVAWWRNRLPVSEMPFATLLLATLWLLVPLTFAYVATISELAPLWMRRYVMVSAAAPMVMAGTLCALAGTQALRAATATSIFVATVLWLALQWPSFQEGNWIARSRQDWRSAIAEVQRDRATAAWPVLMRSGLIEADQLHESRDAELRAYCLLPVASIYRLDAGERELIPLPFSHPFQLPRDDAKKLLAHDGFWLIAAGNQPTKDAALKSLRRSLRNQHRSFIIERAENFGGVWAVKVTYANDE